MKKCGSCLLAYYCDVDCQTKDWSCHKKFCIRNTKREAKEMKREASDAFVDVFRDQAMMRQVCIQIPPSKRRHDAFVFGFPKEVVTVLNVTKIDDKYVAIMPITALVADFPEHKNTINTYAANLKKKEVLCFRLDSKYTHLDICIYKRA